MSWKKRRKLDTMCGDGHISNPPYLCKLHSKFRDDEWEECSDVKLIRRHAGSLSYAENLSLETQPGKVSDSNHT